MYRWVELFLALRYLRTGKSYVSAITGLALLGVVAGVMVLIVVLAVMEGFEVRLREKVIGFNAHVVVNNGGIIRDYQELTDQLRAQPGVLAATPFVSGPVMVTFQGLFSTPFIKGLDLGSSESVVSMKNTIIAGEWITGPGVVVVGDEWARRNNAWVGDTITVYAPRNMLAIKRYLEQGARENSIPESIFLPQEYRIVGVFSTGFYDYDVNFLLMDLLEAQSLYNLLEGVQGIALRVEDPWRAFEVQRDLNAKFKPPMQAESWMDLNRISFESVAMEKRVMAFILLFVMLVAAIGICSTLITVTVQKTKEIGVMKALGALNNQIVAIFTFYGFMVGLAGAFLGTVLGLVILHYRNEFSDWLERVSGKPVFAPEVYHFMDMPAIVDPWTIAWIAVAGVGLSTLGALVPAFLAARVDPVKALHGE